jgi:O-6-methylguanine DNA methyltransferase
VARLSASDREIRSGSLAVRIKLDAAGHLTEVTLPKHVPAELTAADLSEVLKQLEAFPLADHGAPFMCKVREKMQKIPWGHALTYGELAAKAGSPKASRAVGQACARNPLPLIIPCHRVLAEGGIGGFGSGLEWKSTLLALETEARP